MAVDSQVEATFAAARAARSHAHHTAQRAEQVMQETRAIWQAYQQKCAQAERLREAWVSGRQDRLPYSPSARLHARLASMPVIEQAKGILMAQSGWTAEEAFDALRRASQRSNVRVRDLASKIVANTASAPQARQPGDHRPPPPEPARSQDRMAG